MVIVAAMTAMQLRGLDWMVRFSTLLLVLSLAPTVLFTALGAPQLRPPVLLRRDGPVEWPLLVSFVFWLDSARCAILGAQFSARNSAHLSDGRSIASAGLLLARRHCRRG